MACGIIPKFDDEPEEWKGQPSYCRSGCKHKDCAEVQKLRASKCALCDKGFEKGQGYYNYPDEEVPLGQEEVPLKREKRYVHADCFRDKIEKEMEAKRHG